MTSSAHLLVENLQISVRRNYFDSSLRDQFIKLLRFSGSKRGTTAPEEVLIRDLSFSLKGGDRMAILGKNGSGKSSLCRSLAGLYPFQGSIVSSHEILALLDCQVSLFPELTGFENAEILVKLLFKKRKIHRSDFLEALEFSDLGEALNRPVKYYSPGMNARLGLSLVSMVSSPILIMDEVFSGADSDFQGRFSQRMGTLVDQAQILLLVSHDLELIRQYCNCALVLHAGKSEFYSDLSHAISVYQNH
jgi:lipopolysaccharide transport system ATP-binding protein